MKLVQLLLILSLSTFCANFCCAATNESLEGSQRLQLFSVDVQSEVADFWKTFFGSMFAFFDKLTPKPQESQEAMSERWRWI